MLTEIATLERVLKNIEPFETKEDIVHEIKTMLEEAEIQLHKDTVEELEYILTTDFHTEEEKKEIREDLETMKRNMKQHR